MQAVGGTLSRKRKRVDIFGEWPRSAGNTRALVIGALIALRPI